MLVQEAALVPQRLCIVCGKGGDRRLEIGGWYNVQRSHHWAHRSLRRTHRREDGAANRERQLVFDDFSRISALFQPPLAPYDMLY